jgi:hypothetical protein cdivTM_03078
MASDESYERLMKDFDNLQRLIDDTRNGIDKMERDYQEWKQRRQPIGNEVVCDVLASL